MNEGRQLSLDSTRRKWRRIHCPHCNESLGKSCYYRHREAYYDAQKDQWRTEPCDDVTDSESCGSDHDISENESSTDFSETVMTDGQANAVDQPLRNDEVCCDSSSSSDTEDLVNREVPSDEEIWPSSDSDDDPHLINQPNVHPVIQQFFLFTVFWQFAYNVSNSAIGCLLRFVKYFVRALGVAFQCEALVHTAHCIPVGLQTVHKLLGIAGTNFMQYVVCPKCHSVYEYKDCIIRGSDGQLTSKSCCHIAYPKHPQASRRKSCGSLLLKKVRAKSGTTLQPIKVYPYCSLKESIARLAIRPGFLEMCEKWRSRPDIISSQYLGDIYDGQVWCDFNSSDGFMFLTSPFCYLLTINVDWFEPFQRGVYSLGVIYLTVQNLPRNVRYKPENIILVGVMPGPKEASLNINPYLSPLVLELQQAWNEGFTVMSPHQFPITVKLALSCVACDIPASRKVSGFLGHNAALGCNKCRKVFGVKFGQPTDYSGFDRENWVLRSGTLHRQNVNEILKETTKTGIASAESKYGVRYSVLLALPYFDPVRHTTIDVMHNLFLGTAKHMFQLWIEKDLLTKEKLTEIDSRIRLFQVPSEIGRLPACISSQYGGFTANQWRNWILLYSPVVLKGLLPTEDLVCWLLFVRACYMICSPLIKIVDVESADLYFLQFCRRVESLYGKMCCTPNLHLHLHLKQCLMDYGPPHAFWCFSFERYNGILGSYHTNKKSIECQFMRKFLMDQAVQSLKVSPQDPFYSLLPSRSESANPTVVVSDICSTATLALNIVCLHKEELHLIDSFVNNGIVIPLPPFHEKVFEASEVKDLTMLYNQLYPNKHVSHFPHYFELCGRVTLAGDLIGSVLPGGNQISSSVIMAFWAGSGNNLLSIDYDRMRVGVVQKFIKHTVTFSSAEKHPEKAEHIFAYVKWKKVHPFCDFFGLSATVCIDLFEPPGVCSFLPVQRIACRAAHAVMQVNFGSLKESVFVACPLPIHFYL